MSITTDDKKSGNHTILSYGYHRQTRRSLDDKGLIQGLIHVYTMSKSFYVGERHTEKGNLENIS